MKCASIREAVERLHVPTRNWVAMREALSRLARDPSSRLAGIRDVALYMIPAYLPDPRSDGMADIAADRAAFDKFVARYFVGDRYQMDKLREDFPGWPPPHQYTRPPHNKIKFHAGLITVGGSTGMITYRNGVPIAPLGPRRAYCGHSMFYDASAGEYVLNGVHYPYHCQPKDYCALPCGLVLQNWDRDFTKVINLETGETCVVDKTYPLWTNDYGVSGYSFSKSTMLGARPDYDRIYNS